ncbi:MAG: MgtC/SapB family protein [Myxococcales bacterium]|nr:MgtC/SapB family protein [Myxococcales bacterium]MCB9672381.1 MgtC/SapB family protein [Alphaproteobacteria bacterium]
MGTTLDPALWAAVAAASVSGGIIGLERQLAGRALGVRTAVLVSIGTVVFVHVGSSMGGQADPARVLGQVVTGVGFLGAGVLFQRDGTVSGLTTAASVWLIAAIAATIAVAGHAWDGLLLAILTVVGLRVMRALERRLPCLRGTPVAREAQRGEDQTGEVTSRPG